MAAVIFIGIGCGFERYFLFCACDFVQSASFARLTQISVKKEKERDRVEYAAGLKPSPETL